MMDISRYKASQILDFYKILDGYADKIMYALKSIDLLQNGSYKHCSVWFSDFKGGTLHYPLPADEDVVQSLEFLYCEVVRDAAAQMVNSLENHQWDLACVEEKWRRALFEARMQGYVPIGQHLRTDFWIGDEFIQEQADNGREL